MQDDIPEEQNIKDHARDLIPQVKPRESSIHKTCDDGSELDRDVKYENV